MPAGAAQPVGIGAACHHQIDLHAQPTQDAMEAPPTGDLLGRRELGLAHDHRQIQIGIEPRLTPCPRPEDHHSLHIGLGAQPPQSGATAEGIQTRPQLRCGS